MRKWLTLFYLLCYSVALLGQQMQEGYDYLDRGQWAQAQDYFENILLTYPKNKTANICYNRALGLNGNPDSATRGFEELLSQYPDDYEVLLNLAESYLWQKNYAKAIKIYAQLNESEHANEIARMGYANALSHHDSKLALHEINAALELNPNFEAAKISKKYILLKLASDAKNNLNFEESRFYLNEAKELFPTDNEILLLSGQLQQLLNFPRKANHLFDMMNKEGLAFDRHLSKSYSYLLLQQNKKAESALQALPNMQDLRPEQQKRWAQSYINILAIQNDKTLLSDAKLTYLQQQRDTAFVELTDVRSTFWNGRPYQANQMLEQFIKKHPKIPAGKITQAEIQFSLRQHQNAIESAQDALQLNPTDIGTKLLLKRIERDEKSQFQLGYYYEKDEDVTNAGQFEMNYQNFHVAAFTFGLGYKSRTAKNKLLENKSSNHHVYGSAMYHWRGILTPSINLGYAFQTPYAHNAFIYDGGLEYKWRKILVSKLGYRKSLLDYSTGLIDEGIYIRDLYFNNNILTSFGLGWYLQLVQSDFADGNNRLLAFSSLYFNILKVPLLQTGINFNYMKFDENRSELYFSPSAYNFVELFVKVRNMDKREAKVIYECLFSFGEQKIYESEAQRILRMELNLGYRINEQLELLGYYQYSNSSFSTAAGYTFNKIGMRLSMRLPVL